MVHGFMDYTSMGLWRLIKLSAEAHCLCGAFCLKGADKSAWKIQGRGFAGSGGLEQLL